MAQIDGLVVVDKPSGCTSHDVVARCRRVFGQRRAGHAGTLDPDATGILLVGLGRATRLLQFFTGLRKVYKGQVVLGVATGTLDASGEVVGTWDMGEVTLQQARQAAAILTGPIMQVPPMVSALKVGGRRLHELAREGTEVERAPRAVTVYRFDVSSAGREASGPVLAIDVECSAGTYVRSLAADLGAALGGGGHLRNLRRTAVGPFGEADAVGLDELVEMVEPRQRVLSPARACAHLARAQVGPEVAGEVGHGRVLPVGRLLGEGPRPEGPWAVLGPDGELLAVYQAHGVGTAKPVVVLAPASGR